MALDSCAGGEVNVRGRIVGIVLVRDEDLRLAQVLANIADFCDEIFVADHGSQDQTPHIVSAFAAGATIPVSVHRIAHPRDSHDLISPLAGTATWVFGVDGDELYDPAGLARFRVRLLNGEFDRHWMILGSVLNCVALQPGNRTATGHLAPPCRSITKLYNFAAIDAWRGPTRERLHGGLLSFKPGHHAGLRRDLHEEVEWEAADLRCLHLCFLQRSSRDRTGAGPRENIMEKYPQGLRGRAAAMMRLVFPALRTRTDWKRSRYMRGPAVTKSVDAFFPSHSTPL